MPIERIALINKGFAKMSVQRILLTVLVLALPALGYTQEAQAPPSARQLRKNRRPPSLPRRLAAPKQRPPLSWSRWPLTG